MGAGQRTSIAVAVCTYKRNQALGVLLRALVTCAAQVRDRAAVAVVVIDDTAQGEARGVVEACQGLFELGVHYRIAGDQNISLARNLALATASELADWTAMTDDDCEPGPEWLDALLDAVAATAADTATGSMIRRAPPNSPRWLTAEPFLELGNEWHEDRAELTTASTNNSMISNAWLRAHPLIRFDPDLGVIGGEDMVFYRTARAAGLRIVYSRRAFVYEDQPASRTSLRYQLGRFLWQGNSSYWTCIMSGRARSRMLLNGVASMARSFARPVRRIASGQNPQLRYSIASLLEGVGKVLGFFGVKLKHH